MPGPNQYGRLALALSAGAMGGAVSLLAEFGIVLATVGDRITGSWELTEGLLALSPAWLVMAMPLGALGGLLVHRAALSSWFRVEASGLAFAFGSALGYGVGGGRHLASPIARFGFAFLVATLGTVIVYALAPRLRTRVLSLESGSKPWSRADSVAVFVALVSPLAINHLVLVRLYPAFHAAWSAIFVATAGAITAAYARRKQEGEGETPAARRWTSMAAWLLPLVVFGASLALLEPLAQRARGLDNLRFVVSEGSPTLKLGVLLSSQVAPPPPLDLEALKAPLGSRTSREGIPRLQGRSFLLISIDALRADHMGTYGYERPTTPVMDALSRSGFVFDAAYSATPHTSFSLTSLLTGKYMRPLLLQGAGDDSDLLPAVLQTYGYRTAAFYPPAVFYVAKERFRAFERARFGFEYGWVEFAEGEKRVAQVTRYLEKAAPSEPLFVWVHLFGPHEPYEVGETDFGKRDIDRYDSEIRTADKTVGVLVEQFRRFRPGGVVIVTADHGEEFGEHGGRYHGTTVYEEQVRVPMIWNAEGAILPGRSPNPVQTIDVMPTLLSLLDVPIPPRVRGRDLSRHFSKEAKASESDLGFAAAETETMTLLAGRASADLRPRHGRLSAIFAPKRPRRALRYLPSSANDIRATRGPVRRARCIPRSLRNSRFEERREGPSERDFAGHFR
jgi:Sulfatase